MIKRRKFLAQAGLAGAAVLLNPQLTWAKGVAKVGLQLYSLRDYIPHEVDKVIDKVARAGYGEVETYGYSKDNGFWGYNPHSFAALLQTNGLTSPSGHYSIDQYLTTGDRDDLNSYIKAAHELGQSYIIVPGINGDLVKTVEGCKAIAAKFNEVAKLLKKEGLKFAYHNHAWEWTKVDDTSFYNTLLTETDPKLVKLEMDIYWVVRAGLDPVAMLEKHPGRFELFHVKDADKNKPELNTEVGTGSVNFASIFAKAKKAGVKHYIVEQENFTDIDPYVSIAKSAAYVKGLAI